MALLSKVAQVARKAVGRSGPRLLTVKEAWRLTPNMIRVVFAGPELAGFPEGIDVHWLVQPDPHKPSTAQEDLIRSLDWPDGRVQTCIAGESGVIRSLRGFLANEKHVTKEDTYISGYWKIGLIEDQHQKAKRAGTA